MTETQPFGAPQPFERMRDAVGAVCAEATLLEDGSLGLRLTGPDVELTAVLPWRIRGEGAVALSSWDAPETIGSMLPGLVGRELLAVAVEPSTLSLTLELAGATTVETFTTRRDAEHWTWRSGTGAVVAGPGGQLRLVTG